MVSRAVDAGYNVFLGDGGSTHEAVKELEKAGATLVVDTKASMGQSRRSAIRCAHNNGRPVVCWTEPEKEPLGTAGPLRAAKDSLDSTFIVSNGDELKDIDINAMLQFHRKSKALVTMALTEVEDTTQYGIVDIGDGRIARFVEKPKKTRRRPTLRTRDFT